MTNKRTLHIGTRGSPLALAQANEVRKRLCISATSLASDVMPVLKIIKTTGDKIQDRALKEIGGKGLFSKEIDEALLKSRIDLAVHSIKDLETCLPDGIILAAIIEREDPRDVIIYKDKAGLNDLPLGSVIGTSSLRRQAQILSKRPDLIVKPFRGNIQTRLKKLARGEVDATLLALAGLKRLNMADVATDILDPNNFLPAVGQGAIGITCRSDDSVLINMLKKLNHSPSWQCVVAERAMLAALDGSCRTPIGGLAELRSDGKLSLKGVLAKEDGSEIFEFSKAGPVKETKEIGTYVGHELRRLAGPNFQM